MTVTTLDRPSLPEALGIPGARSVSLLDPDGPSVLWWAGVDEPDEPRVAAVVTLASAATVLAGPVDEFGDAILTSADMFHVIRLVGDGTDHVAHLILSRAGANLAMARREFRMLVSGYAGRPRHAAEPPPALSPRPPAPAPPDHSTPDDLSTPALPRRDREPERNEPTDSAAEFPDVPPDWFSSLIQAPFANDETVLDRILVTLRNL
jgi:hypothetical protein